MQDQRAIPIKDHGYGMVALLAEALTPFPRHDDRRPRADATRSQPRQPGWLARLDRWLWASQQRSVERYLAGSQDVFELERRIRAVERGVLHRYF